MKTTDADFPAALEAAAQGWVGTPFRRLHASKGIGVDCANSVYGCLSNSGLAMPDLGAPTFGKSADIDFQSVIGDFLASLVTSGTLVSVDDLAAPQVVAGDVLLYRINARTQHVTMAIDAARQLHTWPGRLTEIVAIDARWRNRLIAHYRLSENV